MSARGGPGSVGAVRARAHGAARECPAVRGCRHVPPAPAWAQPGGSPRGAATVGSLLPRSHPASVGAVRALWLLEEPRAVGWTPSPTQRTALCSISLPATARSLSQMPQALASPIPGPQGHLSRLAELSPSPQYPQAINRFPNHMWVRAASPLWAGEELLPLSGHETEEREVPGGLVPSRGWQRWQDGTFPAGVTNPA